LINPCIKLEAAPGEMGSLTIYWRSRDKMGIGNPPAESIAAVEPAAVETLRPLDRQFTKGEKDWLSLLILQIKVFSHYFGIIHHTNIWKHILSYVCNIWDPYLNENRESAAGHGCAIKISLRAYVDSCSEFTHIDILVNLEGAL
jgi:hypothetical protein